MHETPDAPRAVSDSTEPAWRRILQHDFAASFVVFLVALPLCMGIAQASGVPVAAGIITGIVGGLLVGLIAGSPLQVSGPAAGLTVLVYGFVQEHGYAALGAVVLLAGLIQFAAGLLKAGQWFRAVSPAVIRGMLSGIGILILASQFHLMVDDRVREGGIANIVSIPESIAKGFGVPELAPAESREVRTTYLHQLSELHEKQEEVRELVVERVSDDPSADEVPLEQSLLEPLVERQSALRENLQRLADEARGSSLASDGTEAGKRFVTTLDRAVAANSAALTALEEQNLDTVRERQSDAAEALADVGSSLKKHDWAALLGLLTIATIVLWQSVTPKRWRIVPGPLLAVLLTTGVAFAMSLPVLYVEVPDNLVDGVHLPSLIVLQDIPVGAIITSAIVFAAVASAETLLCAAAIDKMHTGPRAKFDHELAAQGVGNMACGFLGGLPMTGVIVRSATNVQAGARTRWSAVLHGCWLLLFVVALGPLLRYVPTSVLAGILVYTGFKLIDFKALRDLRAYGKSEVGIFLATVVGIVALDLLSGVLIGIGLSGFKLLLKFSRLKTTLKDGDADGESVLTLAGAATFVRLPKLAAALEAVPPGVTLHLDLNKLTYLDHGCMELIASWAKQHQTTGGEVVIDWDSLHADVRLFVSPGHHFRETIDATRSKTRPERIAG
ncbi:MAG: SulP family inorganic anion transporter [Planctomycetaceae bacterium]